MRSTSRGQWGSRVGFILAASGSAIGLGNIVFFSANAYRFGGGAFYVPYFIALFVIGIPVMILEFGLGHHTRRAFPESLHKVAGRRGEFVGWWALVDFDARWDSALGQSPVARIWRDTGLYDEALNPRPALDTWQQQFLLPR